jgi:adenine-specific DNA-methyltransferase
MNRNENVIDLSKFPTTRFQGSKRKILPWIAESLEGLDYHSVLDAFGGTASVSYLFKRMGKSVTYNDVLKFNYFIGKAIIENDNITLSGQEIKQLLNFERLEEKKIIQNTFEGYYYTREENKWLDQIIENINHYNFEVKNCNDLKTKRSVAYYALFQSCLIKRPFNLFHRKNLNIRLKEVHRSFGNKTSWERSFEEYFLKYVNEANSLVFENGSSCFSINSSVFDIDLSSRKYDLVYLDPPYIKRGKNETADYLKCYHFLEGISRYDEWLELIDEETINKRFRRDFLMNEFTIHNVNLSFGKMIEKFSDSIIVVSYKYGGIPSIDEIVQLLKHYKNKVYVKSKHYKYALNRQNGNKKLNREYLIIGV